jgi:hypothetical protein
VYQKGPSLRVERGALGAAAGGLGELQIGAAKKAGPSPESNRLCAIGSLLIAACCFPGP